MEDIIIPSRDVVEGLKKLKKRVLVVAEQSGLRINWAKCKILQRVDFLGYVIENMSHEL